MKVHRSYWEGEKRLRMELEDKRQIHNSEVDFLDTIQSKMLLKPKLGMMYKGFHVFNRHFNPRCLR